MRGIKLEILGLGIMLFGMTMASNNAVAFTCGALGLGLAACGCFYMKEFEEKADE